VLAASPHGQGRLFSVILLEKELRCKLNDPGIAARAPNFSKLRVGLVPDRIGKMRRIGHVEELEASLKSEAFFKLEILEE
jgi:hypothetical protein